MARLEPNVPKIRQNYFYPHLAILNLMGVFIAKRTSMVDKILSSIYTIFTFTFFEVGFCALEIVSMFNNWGDLDEVTFSMAYIITHVIGLIKALLMLRRRENIWQYVQRIESDMFKPNYERGGVKEYDLINKAIRLVDLQALLFHVVVVVIVINRALYTYYDAPKITKSLDEITNTTLVIMKKRLPFTIWFPLDITVENIYKFAFWYELGCAFCYGLVIGSIDTLITGMLVHIKTQILILKSNITGFMERAELLEGVDKQTGANAHTEREMRELKYISLHMPKGVEILPRIPPNIQKQAINVIKNCIEHHKQIIDISEKVEEEINLLMLAQFLGSVMMFCVVLFQLSLVLLLFQLQRG